MKIVKEYFVTSFVVRFVCCGRRTVILVTNAAAVAQGGPRWGELISLGKILITIVKNNFKHDFFFK